MEDSAVVFEEFRDTAGVMEEEGLLPNVQIEEMEQGETVIKPTGMDIRSKEELGLFAGNTRGDVSTIVRCPTEYGGGE